MPDYEDRPYRPCVGIILLNRDGHVFVGQRIDSSVEAWQMPQGGIDEGETPLQAGMREMLEEVGTDNAVYIGEYPEWLDYDIPEDIADRLWSGRYRGQTQKWLAFRFSGDDSEIDIATDHAEFKEWKWAAPDALPAMAVPFKRHVYETVLNHIRTMLVD